MDVKINNHLCKETENQINKGIFINKIDFYVNQFKNVQKIF